jgi:hypothetical protein
MALGDGIEVVAAASVGMIVGVVAGAVAAVGVEVGTAVGVVFKSGDAATVAAAGTGVEVDFVLCGAAVGATGYCVGAREVTGRGAVDT